MVVPEVGLELGKLCAYAHGTVCVLLFLSTKCSLLSDQVKLLL